MKYIEVDNLEEATHVLYDYINFKGTKPGKFYEIIEGKNYIDEEGDNLAVLGWYEVEHSLKLYKLIK